MFCVGTFLTPLLVCIVTGSKMDQSATDIYLEDICGMVAAYSKEGSPEAADRKLSILFGKIICGRAAEAAWTTFEGMQSDKFHAKDFAEVPQIKTSKPKYTRAELASTNRSASPTCPTTRHRWPGASGR